MKWTHEELSWRVKGLRGLGFGIRAISRKLGISPKLAWDYVRHIDAGGAKKRRHKENALERWIRAHPSVRLPRSRKALAAVTGIPSSTLSSCLRTRRRKFEAWVKWLGPLEERRLILTSEDGVKLSMGGVARYEWVYDEVTQETRIEAQMVTGEKFVVPILDRFDFGTMVRMAPRRGEE